MQVDEQYESKTGECLSALTNTPESPMDILSDRDTVINKPKSLSSKPVTDDTRKVVKIDEVDLECKSEQSGNQSEEVHGDELKIDRISSTEKNEEKMPKKSPELKSKWLLSRLW